MTETDLYQTKKSLELIKILKLGSVCRIGAHSCNDSQISVIKDIIQMTPEAITKNEWDITQNKYNYFDLLCFFNVFMYIDNPKIAFNNVFNSCKYLLIKDVIIRDRGDNILGDDGDSMRLSYKKLRSNFKNSFDLSIFKKRIIFFIPYIDNQIHIHFICLMKGNL